MAERTLGDVPGLDDLLPNSAILPPSYTYAEVNPLGELTTDDSLLGDLSMGMGSGDPFAYHIGFLDDQGNGNGIEGGGGYVAVHDPMQSSYLPSFDGTPAVVPGPQAAGEEFSGGGKGDPYALTEIDGHEVDNMTAAALEATAKIFKGGYSIMQGSHSTSVAASGNTHAGGGVIDIAPNDGDWVGLMTALRKVGFAAWIRNLPGYGQAGDGAHIHAVLIGDESASPEALTQIQSYLNNDDGLSGSRADDGPRQYINNRFIWGKPEKKPRQGPTWRDRVTRLARGYVGTPFKWGGEDYSGIDAESLVHNIYSQVGADLPLVGEELRNLGEPADIASAQSGDLIGWHDPAEGLRFGIYLGNGRLIEAGGPGRVVQVNELGADALNVFGIPIQRLIDDPQPRAFGRPAPGPAFSLPDTPAPANKFASDITPAVPSGGRGPDRHGPQTPGTGALNPDKPHTPLPGQF